MKPSPACFAFPRHGVAAAVLTSLTATGLMLPLAAFGQTLPDAVSAVSSDAPTKSLGVVTINSGQPTSLPTQIPTTMEGITREQIEQTINATNSEDALKYFPSLLVRKRYIGDYNDAILSSRASGTGNRARSAVYADGILLSAERWRRHAGQQCARRHAAANHPYPQRSYTAELKFDL